MKKKMEETRYTRFLFPVFKRSVSSLRRDPLKSKLGVEPFEIN